MLNYIRNAFGNLRISSHNNRKMTKGRVDAGKSTFKGTETEHQIVRLEKDIWEKATMIFALDIKIKQANENKEGFNKLAFEKERSELFESLNDMIEVLKNNSSERRFSKFMERLDKEDEHRRNKHELEVV